MVKHFTYIIILLLLPLTDLIQQDNKISQKQSELNKLKEEIVSLQKELDLKQRKEKESFSAVENYSRQGHLINKLLNSIREEEAFKKTEIIKYESEVRQLRQEIKRLQDNYAKYVRAVYKYGRVPEWTVVADAASINQALLRVEYLRRFASRREADLRDLKENREKLISSINILETEKKEKSRLAAQKQEEEKILNGKLSDKKKILAAIRTDKKELRKELDAKKNAEGQIRNMITRLVEEAERKRKEEAARLAALEKEKQLLASTKNNEIVNEIVDEPGIGYDVDLSTSSFSSFAAAKGKLKWPVAGGKVIRKFGENRNNALKTITMNNGIDIKAGKDINVKSVAEGVVSAIDWVPGYGSVIILTHKGEYRTVYGHLSEIFVKEGDKVKSGALIASTAENTEGHILHFEIWNSRSNQNPETWLSKK